MHVFILAMSAFDFHDPLGLTKDDLGRHATGNSLRPIVGKRKSIDKAFLVVFDQVDLKLEVIPLNYFFSDSRAAIAA